MRPVTIALVGFVCLLIIFLFVAYVQLALFCLALVVCLPLVLGFIWQGHKQRSFWISTVRRIESSGISPELLVRVEGRSFPVRALPPRLQFTIRRRNLHLLVAVAFVAIGAALACVLGTDSLTSHIDPASSRYYEFYALCYVMAILLFPALAWLSECAVMRTPGITLAHISGRPRGGFGTVLVRYQFVDQQDGYYGGTAMDFGGSKDDLLKVVFFDPKHPGFSKLSCGFLFHRVAWALELTSACDECSWR